MNFSKVIVIAMIISVFSCKEDPKYYAVVSGKIENPQSDSLSVGKSGIYKTFRINSDGTFRDTIKPVEEGLYTVLHGSALVNVYLKNGFESEMYIDDTRDVQNSISYKGDGADLNTYGVEYGKRSSKIGKDAELFKKEKAVFDKEMENFLSNETAALKQLKEADSSFVNMYTNFSKTAIESWKSQNEAITAPLRLNGKPAPNFSYVNHAGGKTSLSDFKGKYVYIDLWATWCKPCLEIMPYLEKTQEKYKDKNIVFLSISVDKEKDGEKWRNFVTDKKLKGIQLWTEGDNLLKEAYSINQIPQFIIIDPDGNTLKANAPFPVSDNEDYKLFDDLMTTLDL